MQEHFRGKIIKRMLGEAEFKAFADEYNKFKAYGIYKEVFKDESVIEKLKSKIFNF